jgi:RNA polymerase sigma-70 factor (sigma-E family)
MGRGHADQAVAALEDFLATRGRPLLHAAVLLAGSQEAGEDLMQAALERVFRHWSRIEGDPEGYLRRTLYHLAADGRRRQRSWRAKLHLLSRTEITADATIHVDQRDELVRLLRQLPPRQRTAIVLRYWEQLTEAEAAQVMGCSPGTVKSATSRGLHRLRVLSGISDGAGNGAQQATGRTS